MDKKQIIRMTTDKLSKLSNKWLLMIISNFKGYPVALRAVNALHKKGGIKGQTKWVCVLP